MTTSTRVTKLTSAIAGLLLCIFTAAGIWGCSRANPPASQPAQTRPVEPQARGHSAELQSDVVVYPPPDYDFVSCVDSIKAEHDSLADFYQVYFNSLCGGRVENAYGLALANQVLGLLRNDPSYVQRARVLFAAHAAGTLDTRQREFAGLGVRYCDSLLSGDYPQAAETDDVPTPIQIRRLPPPQKGFTRIILGESAIHVKKNALVKTQADRVTRDWLLGHNAAGCPWDFTPQRAATWHEGMKIRELIDLADVKVSPVWGTRAKKFGDDWYAPDAEGAWRFKISPDKLEEYPSTIVIDDRTAVINDTHGISAIAWDSLGADLAVGCGDHPGKMDAAYYLAERGVNVHVPFDRFLGLLMGADVKATIIGSGPIRKDGDGAVIGGQPVTIDVGEPIVVSFAKSRYPLQYYDAPQRYFKALAEYAGVDLNITAVEVTEYGKADNVVAAAEKSGAKVLGIRVKSKQEHDAVAAWLKRDPARRAVLFHTAAYPDGYKLFAEFPRQTSFGDIHPRFE